MSRGIVATNGCFDVLTAAHVIFLQQAKALGELLIIGLNSDSSVRALKGPQRPINNQHHRMIVLSALSCVNRVEIFDEVRATEFLKRWEPDIYVKAISYSLETLDPGERAVLEGMGTEIRFLPMVGGLSTTAILEKINKL